MLGILVGIAGLAMFVIGLYLAARALSGERETLRELDYRYDEHT